MAAFVLAGGAASAPSARAPDSLEALMGAFASSGGVRARFEETRMFSILAAPIETRGFIYFAPPDRLARVTTHPGASTVVVRGTDAALADETGRRDLDLASSEVARGLVGNLLVLLRGDLPELRKRYSVSYVAEGERWKLDLVPRSRALRAVVERVRVTGEGEALIGLETLETNGDTTSARFSEVERGIDFDAGEGPDVFSLEPIGQGR